MVKGILFGLVSLSFFLIFTLALAQESMPGTYQPSASQVEYVLPYPGLLPDHPLYFLKLIRDNILMLLISNPVKKVEFYFLTADKRLNMGVYLLDKNKADLGLKSFADSGILVKKAQDLLISIPVGENSAALNLKEQYEKLLLKHLEVLEAQRSRISLQDTEKLQSLLTEMLKLKEEFSRNK